MKQLLFAFLIATFFIQTSCGNATKKTSKETKVKIETEYGDLIVKLYNQTPLHRDNFIKLANEGFYDDLLFHRVINGFMIQGGDIIKVRLTNKQTNHRKTHTHTCTTHTCTHIPAQHMHMHNITRKAGGGMRD